MIHYNGQTFDLPYLKHKYEDYKLPDPLSSKESLDLYRIFRPWQKPLGLPSLKQKDGGTISGHFQRRCLQRRGTDLLL